MLKIGDPVLRRDIFEEVTFTSSTDFADYALSALEAANVPEEWKQRWRAAKPAGK